MSHGSDERMKKRRGFYRKVKPEAPWLKRPRKKSVKEMDQAKVDARLDRIEQKLDAVIALLEPVHSHAAWVDGLRSRLHGMGLVRNTPAARVAE